MGRWGKKVPATVGTVTHRFALLQLGALRLEGTLLAAEDTKASAVGTGPLLAQRLGLLLQEGLQGAFRESSGSGGGDLLHGGEIDVESGSVVAEGVSGDNLAPLSSETVEFLEFFGSEGARSHDASCLGVETTTRGKLAPVRLRRRT